MEIYPSDLVSFVEEPSSDMSLRDLAKQAANLMTEINYKLWDAAREGDRQRHDRLEQTYELSFKRYCRRYYAFKNAENQ